VTGPLLASAAVLLGAAALWEFSASRGEHVARVSSRVLGEVSGGRARSLADAAIRLGLPGRLQRAGLDQRVPVTALLVAKLGCAAFAALAATTVAPAAPGRLSVIVAVALPVAGFVAPDAMLEREARIRRRRLVGVLPDALDLLGVGAAAGRSPRTVLAEIARTTSGPLAAELRMAVAELESGATLSAALEGMRGRVPGREIGALAAALERSRRYGSPLAEQLREQATYLRREAKRAVEERAARAAPKIQLVVALILVPSVLLMIAAALIANSDALLAGF
jgi:tight adherence protein C